MFSLGFNFPLSHFSLGKVQLFWTVKSDKQLTFISERQITFSLQFIKWAIQLHRSPQWENFIRTEKDFTEYRLSQVRYACFCKYKHQSFSGYSQTRMETGKLEEVEWLELPQVFSWNLSTQETKAGCCGSGNINLVSTRLLSLLHFHNSKRKIALFLMIIRTKKIKFSVLKRDTWANASKP